MSKHTGNSNYVVDIFIDKIKLLKQVCCIDDKHETCVSIKFLDSIEFDICQINDTPSKCNPCSCIINFEKGKSCLFPIADSVISGTKDFKLNILLWQKLSCACLPSKLELGSTNVDLTELFKAIEKGEKTTPLKGFYTMVAKDSAEEVAIMDLIVRVSKLSQIILNEFTMSENADNFLLKGDNDKSAYVCHRTCGPEPYTGCDPAKMLRNIGEECCGHAQGVGNTCCGAGNSGSGGATCCVGGGGGAAAIDRHIGGICCDNGGVGGTASVCPVDSGTGCGCFEKPNKSNDNEYEEIGATLNGNEIKIRVPKHKGLGSSSAVNCGVQGGQVTGDRTMVFGQNEILMSMRQGGPCDGSPDQAFTTKFTKGDPHEGKPTLEITPSNVPQGVEAMKVVDPNKDVFLLRINKKCRMQDKANLELELVTPKPPEKPPKPMYETRMTQYDESDCPLPEPPPPPPPEEPLEPEPNPAEKEDNKDKKKDKKGGKDKGKGKKKK